VSKLKSCDPARTFFYFSGRSSNEAAFLLQLFARLYGTNNVNSCSFYCHQASGVGLSSVTGSGTATITLDDLDLCDTLFLIGGNPASNHPRFMRNLMDLKRRGGHCIVVNPLKELGLVRFKVPSDLRSLVFGTTVADQYVQPTIGSDIAFLLGVAKGVLAIGAEDERFAREHCENYDEWRRGVDAMSWDDIEQACGVLREDIEQAAATYAKSERTIFVWTMGITHHAHGVENVQTIAALAMLRGMLGRPGAGLLPLRGHSNVQGIGSVGVTPVLKQPILDALSRELDVSFPESPGLDTMACMEAAGRGEIDLAICLGGNLFASNPDSAFASQALGKIGLLATLSTTPNTGHCCGLGRESFVLPVRVRDEEAQATTQESMFNYVRLSSGGPARHAGPMSEHELICEIAEAVLGNDVVNWRELRDHDRVRAMMARSIPGYGAIGSINERGEEFTVENRIFHSPKFPTPSGRARFHTVAIPAHELDDDELLMMTIRSEGQFNSVVYEEEDLYRGQERRDVILMTANDLERLGLDNDQRVEVRTTTGTMQVNARAHDIALGCAAMYYPEVNLIVGRTVDRKSRTPAFKSVRVRVSGL
jgi:molybdopterin-dependent oxidoreductase alpha subunit